MSRPTFEQWLAGNGYKPRPCNCGGPQYGTDHAPDCEWEVSALDLQDLFDDQMGERYDYEDDHDAEMCIGGAGYNDVMFGQPGDR